MTSTTAPQETRRGRRMSTLFEPDRQLLLPLDAVGVPRPIARANKAGHDALEAFEQAEQRARQAESEAEAAPRFDVMALDAATAAGEDPPTATAEAKRAKAALARDQAASAQRVAKAAVIELYHVVAEHRDEFLAGREAAAEQAVTRARAAIAEIAASWPALSAELELLKVARRWEENPQSAALSPQGRPRAARTLERARARQAELRPDHQVERTFEHLVAALELLIEREVGS
jgi:hypothetical protein